MEWFDINNNGRLIEFSESYIVGEPSAFGVVEFDYNIRLIGKISYDDIKQLKIGIHVRMIRCGINDNEPYYEFQPI